MFCIAENIYWWQKVHVSEDELATNYESGHESGQDAPLVPKPYLPAIEDSSLKCIAICNDYIIV